MLYLNDKLAIEKISTEEKLVKRLVLFQNVIKWNACNVRKRHVK